MTSIKYDHSILRSEGKKPTHQRNLTAVETIKYSNLNIVDAQNKDAQNKYTAFNQNTLNSQRFSCF